MNPKYQKVLSDIEKAEKKKSEIEGQGQGSDHGVPVFHEGRHQAR